MNLDLSLAPRDIGATTRRYFPLYTGPVLYTVGGEEGLAEALGIGKIFAVCGAVITDGTNILIGVYDTTTEKLLWFVPNTGVQAAAVDLSTFTGTFEVIGQ